MRRPDGRMLLAGVARFIGLLVVLCIVACVGGLLIGALLHESHRRGIAIGFYLTGSLLAGSGFLMGTRPPVRRKSDTDDQPSAITAFGAYMTTGSVRFASRDERQQAMNLPAVLIVAGLALILIGAFVDVPH